MVGMNSQTKFRSLKSLAKYLSNNSVDNFIFNGLWFTLDYYDSKGRLMTYGNKTIECETENRYISRKDINCTLEPMLYDLAISYIN